MGLVVQNELSGWSMGPTFWKLNDPKVGPKHDGHQYVHIGP